MRKQPLSIEDIKKKIISLKGQQVQLMINRGRRKIMKYDAVIEDAYSSVFTVKNLQKTLSQINTYSYNDILCGAVKIASQNEKFAETIA